MSINTWLNTKPSRREWENWTIVLVVLLCVGFVAALPWHVIPTGSFDSVVLIEYVPAAGDDLSHIRAECQTGCAIGSGVSVPGGYIITAAHVIDGGDHWTAGSVITVLDSVGLKHNATVLKIDEADDLAVLKYDAGGPTSPLLCSAGYAVGDTVTLRGDPLFLGLVTSAGEISRLPWDGINGSVNGQFIVLSIVGNHGDSGGPVYDKNGAVVGIFDAIVVNDEEFWDSGFRLAVPASAGCALLTSLAT